MFSWVGGLLDFFGQGECGNRLSASGRDGVVRRLAARAADYFRLGGSREPGADAIANWASRAFLAGDECAGWRPAGIYVGEIECVQLGPEYVALGAEGGVG